MVQRYRNQVNEASAPSVSVGNYIDGAAAGCTKKRGDRAVPAGNGLFLCEGEGLMTYRFDRRAMPQSTGKVSLLPERPSG